MSHGLACLFLNLFVPNLFVRRIRLTADKKMTGQKDESGVGVFVKWRRD